jgi:DNA-binding NtrC family response regulator
MRPVLIVSPDKSVSRELARDLRPHDLEVSGVDTAEHAAQWSKNVTFVCVVFDLRSSPDYPPDIVRKLRSSDSGLSVVFIVDNPTEEIITDLARLAGTDMVRAPIDPNELALRIIRLAELRLLSREADSLRGERDVIYRTDDYVAESPEMKAVLEIIRRVAQQNTNVLLIGETGTGKELLAGSVHYSSPRRHRAFIKVNCAALPEPLLESELFGHEKGAFTGAIRQRIGRFEQADGGSILLDEIGEIGPTVQVKLLRAVQEKEFERLGGERTVYSDIRIIAATNRDLREEVAAGRFREDLYYRLAVLTIDVPPLRERPTDIIPLAEFLLDRSCRSMNTAARHLSTDAKEALRYHDWPGNVRELENLMERAIIMTDSQVLDGEDLGLPLAGSTGPHVSRRNSTGPPRTMIESEQMNIVATLERCKWVQKDAASMLGLSARALNYRIQKLGITHAGWRKNR